MRGYGGALMRERPPPAPRWPSGPRWRITYSQASSRTGWALAGGLLAGTVADALLGDPRRAHPVALFGRGAEAIEGRIYGGSRARGAGFTACCLALASGPVLAGSRLSRDRPAAQFALSALCTWAVIAARSLTTEAERIRQALLAGDIHHARRMLPSLCGRDPGDLDEAGLARAVVESVAENCSDAIVAPLLWGALAGPGGLTAYRAVNALDAMVGHHSARYEEFGWASARLDDVANWLPARLTAVLAAACAPVVAGQPSRTLRTGRRYGPRHPSPNAGWCEAGPEDIASAIRLCRAITAATVGLAAATAAITRYRR